MSEKDELQAFQREKASGNLAGSDAPGVPLEHEQPKDVPPSPLPSFEEAPEGDL